MNLYDFLEEALKCEPDQVRVLGHGLVNSKIILLMSIDETG